MSKTVKLPRCPKCGSPIPAEAAQGICPKCALAAVATPTEVGQPIGSPPPAPSLQTVAAAFPQLEILGLIGAGGMGAVFKARQPKLDRCVALKLLSQPLAGDTAFTERFHREARVLARLNHPGIVSVYDYGEAGGFFYLLMEFVDGVNLRQAMRAGRFTPAQALALVPRICEALQFAHDEGILHRDIKPENILLDTRGRVKIADFGIAKLIGDRAKNAPLTASGLAIGTPHYMAPEQLEHPQDVDQRADIYSLGVVFYEMLTGELPIGRFAPPSEKSPVDPRVDHVVLQALEKERERRQHNVAEVKTEVEQIRSAAPVETVAPSKSAKCYVSTPEHLRTLRGQLLHIYQGSGTLHLDGEALSFASGWQIVTIPLKSISALAVGDYPASATAPLKYLAVTFVERGIARTLLFTPARSVLARVPETDQAVDEWTAAVRAAVQAATGRTLPVDQSRLAQNWPWKELAKAWCLTAVAVTGVYLLVPLLLQQRAPRWPVDFIQGPIIATAVLAGVFITRWKRCRRAAAEGKLDALVSQKPTASLGGSGGTPAAARQASPSTAAAPNVPRHDATRNK